MKARYLSLLQVQAELGLCGHDVDELVRTGWLPTFSIAGHRRVDRRVLEALVTRLQEDAGREVAAPEDGCERCRLGQADDPPGRRTAALTPVADTVTVSPARMTEQQTKVLRFVGEGMSNAEIAEAMFIEVTTVKSHISRLLQRFGLRDREQLIAYLWRRGMMPDQKPVAPAASSPQ